MMAIYCLNCLHSLGTKNRLKSCEKVCENKDFCDVTMPCEEICYQSLLNT